MKEITLYAKGSDTHLIPLFIERIHAGFESPAADYEEARIDLNDYVSKYPEATFFCQSGRGVYDRFGYFS